MDGFMEWAKQTAMGALKAALSAAVAYVVMAYTNVPLAEPYKTVVALLAVALYNQYVGQKTAA
jgi:hypothetical protein